VLGTLSLGCGLLLERVAGVSLPGALRLPAGLAVLIVLGEFTTMGSWSAPWTVPLAATAAAVGVLLSLGRRPHLNGALVALGLGSFALYAAPVVLSGQATFTGYIKLDDTGSFLGFTDQVMAHGRSFAGLAPSTFQRLIGINIGSGYPIGAFLPLGTGSTLTAQDPAWTYQPCMAFYAAMTALVLYGLLEGAVRAPPLRAAIALVAGQAALLYGYALWGGMKELAAAAMIGLTAALVPVRRGELCSTRALLPFATAAAATLGVLSATGIGWVGLLAAPAVVTVLRRPAALVRPALGCVALLAALSIPSLVIARQFAESLVSSSNTGSQEQQLGNLVRPLKLVQIFGIWPTGDFRFDPGDLTATRILIGVCVLSALWGAVYALRRGAVRLPLAAVVCLAGVLFLERESSPWLTAKGLASASPFLLVLGLAGAGALIESGRRAPGAVVAVVISVGVLWSNVLGYRAVWLAPRSQLSELQQIGSRFSGDGPTLMTEYQVYGVRHFLRHMDAEGASELRVRLVPLVDGSTLGQAQYADLDRFRYPDILLYRTFVLRRSPVESRPSSPYRLVWQGRYYDVWQRPPVGGPTVIEHIPLGSDSAPSAVPSCAVVRQAAADAARDGAMLAVARTPDPLFVPIATGIHPADWPADPSQPYTITPLGNGTVLASAFVPRAGVYSLWLDGFLLRDVAVSVDGKHVGTIDQYGTLYHPVGTARLSAGRHLVILTYGDSRLAPGATAPAYTIGPLALTPAASPSAVQYVPPARASTLCGQSLDWIEIVRLPG
jgi:hypothetical protein